MTLGNAFKSIIPMKCNRATAKHLLPHHNYTSTSSTSPYQVYYTLQKFLYLTKTTSQDITKSSVATLATSTPVNKKHPGNSLSHPPAAPSLGWFQSVWTGIALSQGISQARGCYWEMMLITCCLEEEGSDASWAMPFAFRRRGLECLV